MWKYRGQKRPDFAALPAPGQESVWDYPRPPKLVPDRRLVEVYYGDQKVAWSHGTYRALETASPPSFYIPTKDVNWELLEAISKPHSSPFLRPFASKRLARRSVKSLSCLIRLRRRTPIRGKRAVSGWKLDN